MTDNDGENNRAESIILLILIYFFHAQLCRRGTQPAISFAWTDRR